MWVRLGPSLLFYWAVLLIGISSDPWHLPYDLYLSLILYSLFVLSLCASFCSVFVLPVALPILPLLSLPCIPSDHSLREDLGEPMELTPAGQMPPLSSSLFRLLCSLSPSELRLFNITENK